MEEETGGLHVVFTSFFQGCIHCHSGGCILGCSVRQQGMALNNQNSGHNSMWTGWAELYFEMLWLVPAGFAPRTSSVFSKASPAEGNGGRHETRNVGRQSCPTTCSTQQAEEGSFCGGWGLAPDGGAGSGRAYWGAGKDGNPKPSQLCNTQQSNLLQSLPFPSQPGN